MTQLPLVVIEWNDAWIDGTEPVLISEVHVEHKPKVIVTLGWLLKEDEHGVSLACEHYKDDNTYRGRTFIPRGMVISITHYKLTKPRAVRAAAPVKEETTEPGTV